MHVAKKNICGQMSQIAAQILGSDSTYFVDIIYVSAWEKML
jgi:hypothetical protein